MPKSWWGSPDFICPTIPHPGRWGVCVCGRAKFVTCPNYSSEAGCSYPIMVRGLGRRSVNSGRLGPTIRYPQPPEGLSVLTISHWSPPSLAPGPVCSVRSLVNLVTCLIRCCFMKFKHLLWEFKNIHGTYEIYGCDE